MELSCLLPDAVMSQGAGKPKGSLADTLQCWLGRANCVQTVFKRKKHMLCKLQELCANQKAWFAYPEGHVHHDVSGVYETGCAKSGSTTCLPVP